MDGDNGDGRGEGGGPGRLNYQDKGDRSQQQHPTAVDPSGMGSASYSTPLVQPQSSPQLSSDKPPSSPSVTKEGKIQPIKRPDEGGMQSIRLIRLLVNHFHVDFDNESTIYHYDVDVLHPTGGGIVNRKPDNRFIMYQMPFQDVEFLEDWRLKFAYDGVRNIFSAIRLPKQTYIMETSYQGKYVIEGSYTVTINFVREVEVSKINAYLRGEHSYIPRDILQGMDLVMKEDPERMRSVVCRIFYSRNLNDLPDGFAAYQGFQQRLKPTLLGYALCTDYSEPLPVFDYLKANVQRTQGSNVERFEGPNDVNKFREEVEIALKGLTVKVNHRTTNRKYTIAGLSQEDARHSFFYLEDREGKKPPVRTNLVKYFKERRERDITYVDIPCLELGTDQHSIKVPMEFCLLVEGADTLKTLTLFKPSYRRRRNSEMVEAENGPRGDIASILGIELDTSMKKVASHVISAPELKVGDSRSVKVDADKCRWNIAGKSFVDGKSLDRWAFINFTEQASDPSRRLQEMAFLDNLRGCCLGLGIQMAWPLVSRLTQTTLLYSATKLEEYLLDVVKESSKKSREKLQLIVCVMAKRDTGYRTLKWVSDTKIGVLTQCCLSSPANKGKAHYFLNLCLKINAKLGGNNFELKEPLLNFDEPVMFIGAYVNCCAPPNKTYIAAVVGSVNWPAVNRYAARVSSQDNKYERIENFGSMCLDLIRTYAQLNKVKPKRIVVFLDGVSEGQLENVVGEELRDLKESINEDGYEPAITAIVAQTRRKKRLEEKEVESGTMHPDDYDMYLCSHYGSCKTTHYYLVWDENDFTPDVLQKLIYDMCFTLARCTKPVSLVPPLCYARSVVHRVILFDEAATENENKKKKKKRRKKSKYIWKAHAELEDTMYFL